MVRHRTGLLRFVQVSFGNVGCIMKKVLYTACSLNLLFSAFLVANNLFGKDCITCKGGIHLSMSLLSFLGASALLVLCILVQRKSVWIYPTMAIGGVSAYISSNLLAYQHSLGYILCLPCFISEILFYIVFVLICIRAFSMWRMSYNQDIET